MRLWTVHPRYLDVRGLTAVWREGLLARHVLLGLTRGYVHHPQLIRFRALPDPVAGVDAFLAAVLAESRRRGYRYDASKIDAAATSPQIEETTGQLDHEWAHLLRKLETRDPARRREYAAVARPDPHPLFTLVEGPVRDWEKR
ncbi:MAG: pyrimidine dimer DNA glycosylase/endonuclease V [Pseudodesulfovibrio sp.]